MRAYTRHEQSTRAGAGGGPSSRRADGAHRLRPQQASARGGGGGRGSHDAAGAGARRPPKLPALPVRRAGPGVVGGGRAPARPWTLVWEGKKKKQRKARTAPGATDQMKQRREKGGAFAARLAALWRANARWVQALGLKFYYKENGTHSLFLVRHPVLPKKVTGDLAVLRIRIFRLARAHLLEPDHRTALVQFVAIDAL